MGRRVDKLRAGLAVARELAGGLFDAALTLAGHVQHGRRKRTPCDDALRQSCEQDALLERRERDLRDREEEFIRWRQQ